MSGKEKHNPVTERYLDAKEFCDYCNANRVKTSIETLEAYEKHGLLLPIYRLEYPEDYIRAVFEYNHRPRGQSSDFDLMPEWTHIEELNNRLRYYCDRLLPGSIEETLTSGHPLDCAHREKHPLIHRPMPGTFKPWDEYKIVAGTLEGRTIKQSKVEHFYAPWQIFVLDELNHYHTILNSYATGPVSEWNPLTKQLFHSKIQEWEDCFQTLADYCMFKNLLHYDDTLYSEYDLIEGPAYKRLCEQEKIRAIRCYEQHPYDKWIRFIRKLIELHVRYREREKVKLAEELKRTLIEAVEMVLNSTGYKYEQFCDEVDGPFKGERSFRCSLDDGIIIHPGELERIFPNEIKQLKEDVVWKLKEHAERMNKSLPKEEELDSEVSSRLTETLVSQDYVDILTHIYQIEHLWFSEELFWVDTLWAHLRSLAVCIENVGRKWFPKSNGIEGIFHAAFSKYKKLKHTRIGNCDVKTSEEFKRKLDILLNQPRATEHCGQHLLITELTRNYLGHGGQLASGILGSKFINIYRALVETLLSLYKAWEHK